MLVKVIACGVCHTDLHAVDGDWPVKPRLPLVPGHEITGVVSALGPGVTSLKEGDPVGVAWLHDACLRCEYCETGWETLCEHQHNTGYSCDGGFAEYVIASERFAAKLPENVDYARMAPILCAGVTTYKGLKETEAKPGEWVAISGVGGLGHLAIQYAKAMGLHVAALDVATDKLALAKATVAEVAVDARSPGRGRRNLEGDRRRSARRTGHCRIAARLFTSADHGSEEGNGYACRPGLPGSFRPPSST